MNPPDSGRAMPKLIVEFQNAVQEVLLSEGRSVLGRSKKCAISLSDTGLSREHCCFVLADGTVTVEDLGSTNGTAVNGRKLDKPHTLARGETVRIGGTTVWFEERPAAAPKPAKAATGTHKVPAAATSVKRGRAVKDFAVWLGPPRSWALPITVALLVLAAGGAAGWWVWLRPAGPAADPGNLLSRNPSFEAATDPVGWSVASGSATLSVETAGAHHGARCLSVNKAGEGDLAVEISDDADAVVLPAGPAGLSVTAFVRFDSFADSVALKVSWLASPEAAPSMEDWSPVVTGASAWTLVSGTFAPPPGCRTARIALVAAGGPGRFLVDAVRAEPCAAPPPLADASSDPWAFAANGAGTLRIDHAGRPLAADLVARTTITGRGTAPPMPAARVTASSDKGVWKIAGDRLSASPTRPLAPWEARLWADDEGLSVAMRWDPKVRGELDTIELEMILPGAELFYPLDPGPASRIEFSRGGERFRVESPLPVQTVAEPAGPDVRVQLSWPAGALAGPDALSLRLARADVDKADVVKRLRAAAERTRAAAVPGPLADALRALIDRSEDPKETEMLEKELGALRLKERRAFRSLQRALTEATLTTDAALRSAAMESVGDYRGAYDGKLFADRVQTLSELVEKIPEAGAEPGASPSARLLRRAQRYREWGQGTLSELTLKAILDRYPESPEADEARTRLETR